jgi:hypothetical protein
MAPDQVRDLVPRDKGHCLPVQGPQGLRVHVCFDVYLVEL